MFAGGIVAEFNPFHSGHAALAGWARAQGVTHVAAVMSGNFVQRGDFAVTDKRVRTRCALENGVDLVLELPLPHATSPAQHFARGAVSLLAGCGCIDALCFGSESGDGEALAKLALMLDSEQLRPCLRRHLEGGITFARARQQAVEELAPDLAPLLESPNNALALEYLREAWQIDWRPQVLTLKRQGVAHDADAPKGRYASASYLRGVAEDFAQLEQFVPERAAVLLRAAEAKGLYPAAPRKMDTAVLAALRRLSPTALAALPQLSEGLENRLLGAIRQAGTLRELLELVKTKRYTLARVRRLVLHAFLGVTAADVEARPPYLRVLGCNARGKELLSRMGSTASLPVSHSLARLREVDALCRRFAKLEEESTDLYTLALPSPQPCGYELQASGVFLD